MTVVFKNVFKCLKVMFNMVYPYTYLKLYHYWNVRTLSLPHVYEIQCANSTWKLVRKIHFQPFIFQNHNEILFNILFCRKCKWYYILKHKHHHKILRSLMVGKSRANLRYYLSKRSRIKGGFNLKHTLHKHHGNIRKWGFPIRIEIWGFK